MSKTSERSPDLTGEERRAVEPSRRAARSRFAHYILDAQAVADSGPVDLDNPPMTDRELAGLRPAADVAPALVAGSLRRQGGRPRSAAPKVPVSVRLDPDVLAALRSSGEGWQGRLNAMLRGALGLDPDVLAPTEDVREVARSAVGWVEGVPPPRQKPEETEAGGTPAG